MSAVDLDKCSLEDLCMELAKRRGSSIFICEIKKLEGLLESMAMFSDKAGLFAEHKFVGDDKTFPQSTLRTVLHHALMHAVEHNLKGR